MSQPTDYHDLEKQTDSSDTKEYTNNKAWTFWNWDVKYAQIAGCYFMSLYAVFLPIFLLFHSSGRIQLQESQINNILATSVWGAILNLSWGTALLVGDPVVEALVQTIGLCVWAIVIFI